MTLTVVSSPAIRPPDPPGPGAVQANQDPGFRLAMGKERSPPSLRPRW